jgi:SagB-type dehydrogenase family enzyme
MITAHPFYRITERNCLLWNRGSQAKNQENNMIKSHPKLSALATLLMLASILTACVSQSIPQVGTPPDTPDQGRLEAAPIITLPEPDLQGSVSLEQTLVNRRSVRLFQDSPLTDAQIGQLLWAAQGITHPSGLRTAPSAGALYPLEIYAVTQDGLYHYRPHTHSLEKLLDHDPRPALHQAALRQNPILEAPMVIVISAVFERTAQKYGDARTPQYAYLEAGHVAQNILLQAVALDLGAVPIGAFYEDQVSKALSLPSDQTPLYLIPVGYPE